MKEYRVRLTDGSGKERYEEFDTMDQAQELYDSLDGKAEIQKWNPGTGRYEDVVWPTYEF